MKTPIFDFVESYANSGTCRFHMPGHKGKTFLGPETFDITEISGADVLYSAEGIIAESEKNASSLFASGRTFYSAEGSTLAIKAMLALALKGRKTDTPPLLLAGRNAHKTLIYAAALLDFDISWLPGEGHICECNVTASQVERALSEMSEPPFAVYLTTPDYLGNLADVSGIARVCDKYGVPLLVDNAHGAYLAFEKPSCHPIALGAFMCADSAHKTLPVLTGGAYLHLSASSSYSDDDVREALSLFASTSPSYLILQSLDLCNKYLSEGYSERLSVFEDKTDGMKRCLARHGYCIKDGERLKITIDTLKYGYTGTHFARLLREKRIECEFADEEYAVFMLTPENTDGELERLVNVLLSIPKMPPIAEDKSVIALPERVMSIREAVLSEAQTVPVELSVGRICASPSVACPPAVPIVISGEIIGKREALLLKKYGYTTVRVVKRV